MYSLKSGLARIAFAFVLLTLGLVPAASAATSQFQILLNLDNNQNTGCDVPTLTGTFDGVEQILTTTVDTIGSSSAQVTALHIQNCTNPASNTFGPATPVPAPPGRPLPWPVGVSNGTDGSSVIETYYPLSLSTVQNIPVVRLGVLGLAGGTVQDEMLKVRPVPGNGQPILIQALGVPDIPTLSEWALILLSLALFAAAMMVMRRRTPVAFLFALVLLGLAGTAWALAGDLNGNTLEEWGTPLATETFAEAGADAPPGTDIRALFGFQCPVLNGLCFRIDAVLQFSGATNDVATVNEDSGTTTINVLANDFGGPYTVQSVTPAANGTAAVGAGGANVTYTPNANFCGTDTFTYTVTPGGFTATVSVLVNCVDDPPTAVNDMATVPENAAATAVDVLTNDTDIDAGPRTIQSVTQPANGTVVITGGGTGLTYQPNANYCNSAGSPDTFTYTLNGGSTATVSMTVTCFDTPPVAVADAATMNEDSGANTINVLANDTDIDGGPINVASVTQGANGTVVITNGGADLTYAPNANFCGTDTFTYTLNGGSTATVTVTVTCVNDNPVAVNDAATVAEDSGATAVPVLANDTDAENDPFTIQSVTQGANGAVVITGGGTGLTYQPNADFCGTDTFTYTLNPGGSTATVTMTVTCTDDPPVAVNDAATVNEDSGANAINVLANDTDVDAGPISITSVTQPANGAVVITGGGTGLTYTPNANYCNTPPGTTLDTFTYTLTPGGSTATVTVTVTCGDDNPTAVADSATVNEDSGANPINVLANDTDPDGGPISITSVTQGANGSVVITGGGTGLTYQPNANYCGADSFTYTLTPGGSSTTVTITVTCVDDDPTAVADAATVAEDSGANTINVLANDTDPDGGAISITSVTQGTNGTVVNGTTNVTYTPNPNYCGTDTFTYTLTPGGSTATVTVTVTCADDNPVAMADAATVNEDSGANTINVLANDIDVDAGPISITAVTQGANGSVAITNGGADLTYTPNANFCGTDSFNYSLTPGGSTATVTVTVTCLNDGPVIDLDANDDKGTTGSDFATTYTEGNPATLIEDPADATVTDVDSATLAFMTVTITNLFDTGFETLATDVTGTSITANYVVVAGVPGTGTLTLTGPDTVANFQTVLRKVTYLNTSTSPNPAPRRIEFVANDGTTNGNTAVSTVTVVSVDTEPTAVNDAATVNEDSGATVIDVLANDTDPDGGPISISSVTQPANGTVTNNSTNVTYTPNANYCGTDTFTYTLTPGSSTATVTVTVTCVDDNPVAVNDAATVAEDSGANAIPVLANDTDADGGPISITSVTQGANGTVVITGGGTGLTYQPNANYCGADSFTYTLTPGGSTATVTVTVTCVDDNPVAVADAATVVEDSGANAINVLANDTDVDGGAISITAVTQGTNGTVVITGGGTGVSYTPNANYCGTDTFTYTLTPGGSTATVTVTVTCVDDPPVAVADSATVVEDSGSNTLNVLANDTDPDAGPISITSVTQPANGTVAIGGGGANVTYTPNPNYCNNPPGTTLETFTYTLTPASATPTATVTVTVTCVNDAPTLTNNPITYTTPGNTQLHVAGATLPGVASWSDAQSALTKSIPSDVDGPGPLQVVAASGSSANGGSFTISADGSFTYVPPVGFTGTDSFTYSVTDNGTPAATVTGTVNITVGQRVWYIRDVVDANNAAGGDGRSTNAFDSIAAFNAVTTNNGDIIYIFEGNTSTTPHSGSITLRDGQKLWGQGIALDVPGFGTSLVSATNRPRLRTTTASTNVVSVPATAGNRSNVEIRGLDLEATGATSNAIDVTSSGGNTVGITISNNNIRGATAEGIDLNAGATAAFSATVQNNTVTAAGNGVDTRVSASGTTTITASGNTMTSTGGNAFDARTLAGASALRVALDGSNATAAGTGILIDGSAAGTTTITSFSNNVVSGNTVGTGISITSATFDGTPGGIYNNVSGGTTLVGASGNGVGGAGINMSNVSGDLAFTDLDIFADGGAGLRITGTGAVNTGAGTGTRVTVGTGVAIFEATGGPAVDVTNATVDLQLTSIKSTNSPTTGVSLVNVADGTTAAIFSAGAGSSITNATGTDFNVDGGNATISYAATITNTAGRSVVVQNRTGDTATFSGAITDTGTGVFLNSNTGSTISFSGVLSLTTGTSDAFTATGGGTVTATDTTSTITTTTGIGLNVANTTIGVSGLKFRSISAGTGASGPSSGIILNNTGSSGSLTVSGTGGAGSGGTIQRTTGAGISLTSTLAPSFASMNIQNTARSGVKGTQVNGFTLTNTTINNSGTAAIAGSFDSNIAFNDQSVGTEQNLIGTVSITGNTLTNAQYHGVDITNFNGTIADLTLSNNTITSSTSSASSLGSGINLQALGSATTVANVTKATIANNVITNFPSGAGIQALGANANAAGPAGTFGTPGSANVIGITGNRVAGQSAANRLGTNGILVAATGKGQASFDISSNGTVANPLANIAGFGIGVSVRGAVTVVANVTNNILAPNNTFASPAISVGADNLFGVTDAPDLTSTISNNTISQSDGNGILATVRNSNGIGRFKIQNNTVAAPLTGVRPGIRVDSGTASGNTTVCLNLSGNTSDGSGSSEGLGLRKQGTVTTTNTFGVNGMAATSSPGVETYVNGLNPAGGGTLLISATSGFSNCSLP